MDKKQLEREIEKTLVKMTQVEDVEVTIFVRNNRSNEIIVSTMDVSKSNALVGAFLEKHRMILVDSETFLEEHGVPSQFFARFEFAA